MAVNRDISEELRLVLFMPTIINVEHKKPLALS